MNPVATNFEHLLNVEVEEQDSVSILLPEELSLIGGGQVTVNTV